MSLFLDISQVVSIEVAAGRLPIQEAKAQLAVNADIAFKNEMRNRLKLVSSRPIMFWDNEEERRLLCPAPTEIDQ